ncbi:MAG: hypothetical protein M3037_14495 [Gemmatimonadota bacterium]|nr:hypothetical protein [Gemmatimonadota bacterium]
MPVETFVESSDTAGDWTSRHAVNALDRVTSGDLVDRHAGGGIALA